MRLTQPPLQRNAVRLAAEPDRLAACAPQIKTTRSAFFRHSWRGIVRCDVRTSPFHTAIFASRLIRRSYKASADANQPSRKASSYVRLRRDEPASREAMA